MPAGRQGFATIIVILPIVAFLAVFIFLIFKSAKIKTPNISSTPTPIASGSAEPISVNPADWKTYTNSQFGGFEMLYPVAFAYMDEGPKSASASSPATLDTISFTDSNKNRFTLNIFPVSADRSVNMAVDNLTQYNGLCGYPNMQTTLTNEIKTAGQITYKEVAQVDIKGRNFADFCFFSPSGNLFVLKNNVDSTVIAMKHIISTFRFTGPVN